jgi:DNA-directed RNA polymerase subunit L
MTTMRPAINNIYEEDGTLKFTLTGVDVSIANSIRRTALSTIRTVVFRTESFETNTCRIEANTGRLHDQMIQQRIGCIPIHITDANQSDEFVANYLAELDVENTTDSIIYVTTEHFRIKHKETGEYLSQSDVRKIFPPDDITLKYIIIARLRPKVSETIPCERIKLTCDFGIGSADINSMYNVVSECTMTNTLDVDAGNEAWEKKRDQMKADGITAEELAFHERNFRLLDAKRYFIKDSYDFAVESKGVFDNKTIMKKACVIMHNTCVDMIKLLESDMVPILNSETAQKCMFDVVLKNEDYTLGKALESVLYQQFYTMENVLCFIGFRKFHPSDSDSIIRIGFCDKAEKEQVRDVLKRALMLMVQDIYAPMAELL